MLLKFFVKLQVLARSILKNETIYFNSHFSEYSFIEVSPYDTRNYEILLKMTNALENAIAELRSIFSAIEQEHSMKKMARLRCEHCKRSDSDTSPPSESETETETETENYNSWHSLFCKGSNSSTFHVFSAIHNGKILFTLA
jgi:hypothetical protein